MKLFIRNLLVGATFLGLLVIAGIKATTVKADAPLVTSTYDFITKDNGMQGLWAFDHFHSTVTITAQEDSESCYQVVREDGGTFTSIPGAKSPGGTGGTLIGDGTTGTVSGGLTDIVCGTLRSEPLANDTPEDLTVGKYGSYEDKYFHRYFSEIESGNLTAWGWTFTTCNNGTWTDNDATETAYGVHAPSAQMGDITGDFVPCATPTPEPTPIACSGDTHPDAAGKNCVAYQFGGPPAPQAASSQVLGASTEVKGQVLGASTMAATGTFEQNLYMAIMGIGATLTAFGIKNFKKATKKA